MIVRCNGCGTRFRHEPPPLGVAACCSICDSDVVLEPARRTYVMLPSRSTIARAGLDHPELAVKVGEGFLPESPEIYTPDRGVLAAGGPPPPAPHSGIEATVGELETTGRVDLPGEPSTDGVATPPADLAPIPPADPLAAAEAELQAAQPELELPTSTDAAPPAPAMTDAVEVDEEVLDDMEAMLGRPVLDSSASPSEPEATEETAAAPRRPSLLGRLVALVLLPASLGAAGFLLAQRSGEITAATGYDLPPEIPVDPLMWAGAGAALGLILGWAIYRWRSAKS